MGTIIDDLDSINANLYVLTDHIVNGSSSDTDTIDPGWRIENTELFSEMVTTTDTGEGYATGQLAYVFQQEPPAKAVVTFDGTDYVCERNSEYGYGSSDDFLTYPFYIEPEPSQTNVYTETAGAHTVTLGRATVEVSTAFSEAVNSCVELPFIPYLLMTTMDSMTNKTWNEIHNSFVAGFLCFVSGYGPVLQMWYDGNRYYMATGSTDSKNGKFDPVIWRTSGASSDLPLAFYKYDSQMP